MVVYQNVDFGKYVEFSGKKIPSVIFSGCILPKKHGSKVIVNVRFLW